MNRPGLRRRWQCVEPRVRNGTCSGVGVCRDEQAACARRNPQGICVARGTLNRRNTADAAGHAPADRPSAYPSDQFAPAGPIWTKSPHPAGPQTL